MHIGIERLVGVDKKRRELEHAHNLSPKAKQIKLADKTANIRDLATMPPANWSRQRKVDYFDFAQEIAKATAEAAPDLMKVFLRDYEHFKAR